MTSEFLFKVLSLAVLYRSEAEGLNLEIESHLNPMRILEGSQLELACTYRGDETNGILNFYYNNADIETLDNNFTISKTISATKQAVTTEDGGQYRCRHSMLNLAFTTTVQVIKVEAQNQTFNDTGIILGCNPTFYPSTTNDRFILRWFKDGIPIRSQRYKQENTKLLINFPEKELDIGQYNCTFVFSNGTSQEQNVTTSFYVTDDGNNSDTNGSCRQLTGTSWLWYISVFFIIYKIHMYQGFYLEDKKRICEAE